MNPTSSPDHCPPENGQAPLAWFTENLPSGYLNFPQPYLYRVAIELDGLPDVSETRRQFKKLLVDRQLSEGMPLPAIEQKDLCDFMDPEDSALKLRRAEELLTFTEKYFEETKNIIQAQRLAFLELFHKEEPLKQVKMDEAYFRNRELVEADLREALKYTKGNELKDLSASNPSQLTSINTQSGKTIIWYTYLNRASAVLFGTKKGRETNNNSHRRIDALNFLLKIVGCKEYPQADKDGFVVIDGVRYSYPENWARYLKEKADIKISGGAIIKRLRQNDKIGITAKTFLNQVLEDGFFSEHDIHVICNDLFVTSEKIQADAKVLLEKYGIHDRITLIYKGVNWFAGADFPPYGKGISFAFKLLGRTIEFITVKILHQIADVLSFPKYNETDLKRAYVKAFNDQGCFDRRTLIAKGVVWYIKKNFPPFGKGRSFTSLILGYSIPQGESLSLKHLNAVADTLGLPDLSEVTKQKIRFALNLQGVSNRFTLIHRGAWWFNRMEFPPFGKGNVLLGFMMGKNIRKVKSSHLNQLADILGYPPLTGEERKMNYRALLEMQGIYDANSLFRLGPDKFARTSFPPFNKGFKLASLIVGKSVYKVSSDTLRRIVEVLELPSMSEVTCRQYCLAFESHGIPNRQTLLSQKTSVFKQKSFPPYGKALKFVHSVLGRRVDNITYDILVEIADKLGWK